MTAQTIENPQATSSASQPQRTINLILGGKGGTGKTLFARLLYYALVTTGVKTVGIDSDIENPEFVIFHADTSKYGVMALNFGNLSESKKIISVLGGQYQNEGMPYLTAQMPADAIVIDMPAASGKDCRAQFDTLNFVKNCQRWGYQATIITVLNTGTSAIQSLAAMMEHCGSGVNYVAVKSLFWKYSEEGFIRWDNSPERKKFKRLKGKEIELPILPPTTFDALQESHLSFFDLASMDLGDQILTESFLDRGLFQIHQLASVVGLPTATVEV